MYVFFLVSDYRASSYIVFSSVWWHPALFTNQFMMICTMYSRITVGKKGKNSGIILICKCIDVIVCHRSPFSSIKLYCFCSRSVWILLYFQNLILASIWCIMMTSNMIFPILNFFDDFISLWRTRLCTEIAI